MNFSWNSSKPVKNNLNQNSSFNSNLVNVMDSYREVTEGFCDHFYGHYDNDFPQIGKLFLNDTYVTYLDEELSGFTQLFDRIKQYNIYNFKHHKLNVNSQPVGPRTLLLTVNGKISINHSFETHTFTETILLQRDDRNEFHIHNYMLM